MKAVSIDPRSNLIYASMYIKGLQEYFGDQNISFKPKPFLDLKQTQGKEDFDHYFSFFNHQNDKKYVVDFRDKNTLNQRALEWCDVYAKVNLNTNKKIFTELDSSIQKKIVGIGPNFGIKLYSGASLYTLAFLNYFKSNYRLSVPVSFRDFIGGYNWMRKRQKIEDYENTLGTRNCVFHISSYYQNQSHGDKVNELRAAFIRACKNIKGLEFEGGLVLKTGVSKDNPFSDVIIDFYVKNADYILKTKQSRIVFNTPAAYGCHGWKLGEYFAMGKVIISTSFINNIPEGIQHGVNIHLVNSAEDIENAITLIMQNDSYREKLESGSRKYYNEYLKPKSVVRRILDH